MAKSKKSSNKAKPVFRRMRLRSKSGRRDAERSRASSTSSRSRVTKRKGTKRCRSCCQSTQYRSRNSSSTSGRSSSRSTGSSSYGSKSSKESRRKGILKKNSKNSVKMKNKRHVGISEKVRHHSGSKKQSGSRLEEKRGSGSESIYSARDSEDSSLDVSEISAFLRTAFPQISPDSLSGRTSTPIKKDSLYKISILNKARSAPAPPTPRSPLCPAAALPTQNSVDRSPSLALKNGEYCSFKLPIFVESIHKVHVSPKEEKITIETKTILVSSNTTHLDEENLFKARPAVSHVNSEHEQDQEEEVSEHTVLVGKNTVLFHRTTVLHKADLNNNMANNSKKEYNRIGRSVVNGVSGPLSLHCKQGTVVVDDIYLKKELITVFLATEPQMKKKEELDKMLSDRLIREEIAEISTEKVQTAEQLMSTGNYVLMLDREVRIHCDSEMWTNENDYVTSETRSFEFGKNPHGEMSIVQTQHNMSKSILDLNPSFFNHSAHTSAKLSSAVPRVVRSPTSANLSSAVPRVVRSPSMVQHRSRAVDNSHYETAPLSRSRSLSVDHRETSLSGAAARISSNAQLSQKSPKKTKEQQNTTPVKSPAKMGTTPKPDSPISSKKAASPVVAKSPGTPRTAIPKTKTPVKPVESKTSAVSINEPTSFRPAWTPTSRTQSSTCTGRSRSLSPSTIIERNVCERNFWKQPSRPRTPILGKATKEVKPDNKDSPTPSYRSTVTLDLVAEINGESFKLRSNYRIWNDPKELKFEPKKISINGKTMWIVEEKTDAPMHSPSAAPEPPVTPKSRCKITRFASGSKKHN